MCDCFSGTFNQEKNNMSTQNETKNIFTNPEVNSLYNTIQSIDPLFNSVSPYEVTKKAKELGIDVTRNFQGQVTGHRVLSFNRGTKGVRLENWRDPSLRPNGTFIRDGKI